MRLQDFEQVHLRGMFSGKTGGPYRDRSLPSPNIVIPVHIELSDRLFECSVNAFFSLIPLITGILLFYISYNEKSVIMLIAGLIFEAFWASVFYLLVIKYLLLKTDDELVILKNDDNMEIYRQSDEKKKSVYNMSLTDEAWIVKSYSNGSLTSTRIRTKQHDIPGIKKKKLYSDIIIPVVHPVEEVMNDINSIVLYEFINKKFPSVSIGYGGK